MIIVRTPFRVSFAGGGSDLANYYEKYGGAAIFSNIRRPNSLTMSTTSNTTSSAKYSNFTTSGALTSTPAPTFLPAPACLRHQPLPPGLFTCATPTTKPT